MGKGERGRGHGGFHGGHRGHSFGHHHHHHHSFGHHHNHHIGSSNFGHISFGGGSHCRRGARPAVPVYITDPNWENQPNNGVWKGGLFDCCTSPGDCVCACYCPCFYSAMLAHDIGI